jgi:hypothetical protein
MASSTPRTVVWCWPINRAQGLKMLAQSAQFEDGSIAVEAGIMDILDRMQSGRWKVFRHLNEWFDEFRCITAKMAGSSRKWTI